MKLFDLSYYRMLRAQTSYGITLIEIAISIPLLLAIIFAVSDNLLPLLIKQNNIKIALELYLDQDVTPVLVKDIDLTTSPLQADPFETIDENPTALSNFFSELQDGFTRRNDGESSLFFELGLLEIDPTTGLSTSYRIIPNEGANVTSVLGRDCADSASIAANVNALDSYARNYFQTLLAFDPTIAKGIKLYEVQFPQRNCKNSSGASLGWNTLSCDSVSYDDTTVRQYLPWIPVAFYRICEKPTQFIFDNDATVTLAAPVRIMVGQI